MHFVLEMKEKKKSYGLIMQYLLLWYQVDIKSKKGFCLEWKYLFLLCFLFYCLMIPLKTFDLWDPLCFIAFCKNGNIWLTWFLTCLVAIYTLSSRDYMEKEMSYFSSKVIFIFKFVVYTNVYLKMWGKILFLVSSNLYFWLM